MGVPIIHTYRTKNTCSTTIKFDLEGDIVHNVEFIGGCSGNLQAIGNLVEGFTVDQIEKKCKGIHCGYRPTSCSDQLAIAVRTAYNESLTGLQDKA